MLPHTMLLKVLHKLKHNTIQTISSIATICLKTIIGSGECVQLTIFIRSALAFIDQMMAGPVSYSLGLAFRSWCLIRHLYGSSISSSLHCQLQHVSETRVLSQQWMKSRFLILFLQTKNWESSSLQTLTTLLIMTRNSTQVLTTHISQSTVNQLQSSSIQTATLLVVDTSLEI
jgi:hypothetical protein